MRLELSAKADADLADLLAYGSRTFGLETGREYFLSFGGKFESLRERPFAGTSAARLRGDIRCLKHRKHRIFYRWGNVGFSSCVCCITPAMPAAYSARAVRRLVNQYLRAGRDPERQAMALMALGPACAGEHNRIIQYRNR